MAVCRDHKSRDVSNYQTPFQFSATVCQLYHPHLTAAKVFYKPYKLYPSEWNLINRFWQMNKWRPPSDNWGWGGARCSISNCNQHLLVSRHSSDEIVNGQRKERRVTSVHDPRHLNDSALTTIYQLNWSYRKQSRDYSYCVLQGSDGA